MNSLLRRRALAIVAGGAVALSTAVAVTPAASASTTSPVHAAASWLESHVVDGIVTHKQILFEDGELRFVDMPNPASTIDAYLAFEQVDMFARTRGEMLAALDSDVVADYIRADERFLPAAGAKLSTALMIGGRNPREYRARDLIAEIEAKTDDVTGETRSAGGGFGQAWVTRALVMAGSPEAARSVDFLISTQCDNGGFIQFGGCGTDKPADPDATAAAIFALQDAATKKHAGATVTLDTASSALAEIIGEDGSIAGATNGNSIGLAATALDQTGHTVQARAAASWLLRHQITDASAGPDSVGDVGAIAYNARALADALQNGITEDRETQWMMVIVQALPGLKAAGDSPRAVLVLPQFLKSGAKVRADVAGLEPGWKVTASITGGSSIGAVVPASGRATFTFDVPRKPAKRTVTVTDSTGRTVASRSVQVLIAKNLGAKLAKKKVKRKKLQKVVVRRLAAGEPVRVHYRGKLIKRGVANKNGHFVHRFRVGRKAGKSKVVVRGVFNDRRVDRTFRVVK